MSIKRNLFFLVADRAVNFFFEEGIGKSVKLRMHESRDGLCFSATKKRPVIKTKKSQENLSKCSDFRGAVFDERFYAVYAKKIGAAKKIYLAKSKNLSSWEILGAMKGLKFSGTIVPDFFYDEDQVIYTGEKNIKAAFSKDLLKWRESKKILLKARAGKFDSFKIMPAYASVEDQEILLLYYALGKDKKYSLGLAGFDIDNPEKLLHRSEQAIWKQDFIGPIKPLCVVKFAGQYITYWEKADGEVLNIVLPPFYHNQKSNKINLKKLAVNPIMSPRSENSWEALAAFNPTVFMHAGKIHILYRAMGHEAISTVGYAVSSDGVNIEERLDSPIYVPREDFEGANGVVYDEKLTPKYMSGGGWGGCEDARVTIIDNRVYLLYAAYNGHSEPNVAISSISLRDFKNRKWTNWTAPKLITHADLKTKCSKATKYVKLDRPGIRYTGEKDATILPEKINGKYAIFHRIWPNIVVDYVDSLDFDGKTFLRGEHIIPVRPEMWDSFKICIAATPLKIKEGWLIIYNAVDKRDMSKYKLGAMVLDHKDPTKVLYRCSQPILEPEEHYENGGLKYGIVFAGGALIKDGDLYVYYGGSDQHTCIATHNLRDFIEKLKKDGKASLERIS